MRKANKALRLAILLLLVAALTAAVCAEDDAVSTTIDEIPPTGRPEVLDREGLMADTLTITVGYFGGEQYTKYVFTAEELQNMADVQQIYTIIDNMPAVCMDAAVGVRLADILKTAGIDLNSIQLLNFYCADVANTWYTSYSKTALLDTPRYYYPLLPVSWNYDEGQALPGATAGAIQVDAILAVRDKWRRMATTIDFSELTDATRYRILFGQTDVVTIEGSRSAKWVHTIAVTLGGTPPKGVSLNEEMLRGTAGSSFQLEADVERSDETSDIRVSWSSNENVATVDRNGNVKIVGDGEATITVRTVSGNYEASVFVTTEPETAEEPPVPEEPVLPEEPPERRRPMRRSARSHWSLRSRSLYSSWKRR